jgi:hypothetical protein
MKHPRRRLEDELHEVWNDWINDNDYGLWHDVPEVGALGAAAAALGAGMQPPDNNAPGEMLDGDEFALVPAAGGRADPGEGVPRRAAPPAALPVATSRRAASRRQPPSLLQTASAALQSAAGTVTSAARSAADFGVRLQGGLKVAKAAAVAGAHRYLKPIVRPILELNGLGGMLPPSRSASVAQAARAASRSMSVAPAARAASRPLTAAGTGLVPPLNVTGLAAPNAGGGAPSLDGLRLNAGGRVVNAQGRFVSQDVAALYLQRR